MYNNALNKFYKDATNTKEATTKPAANLNFDKFISDFKSNIPNLINMEDNKLAILIKNNLDIISRDILDDSTEYNQLLTNSKFIANFIKAINSVPIDYLTRLACNKITYDYFTSGNGDIEIKRQYLNMSRTVNRESINKLIAIGLDENTACNLSLCRYSSSNERTNVKRLNFTIYNKDPNVMTEQMVVWIYEKLFSKVSDLFYATMFETYTVQELEDFGENFVENLGTVDLAILTILNNMTTENIIKVLLGYSEEYTFKESKFIRFSLHSLSADYSRITRAVEYLENEMGMLIP